MPVLPATVRHVLAAASQRVDPVDARTLLLHVLQRPPSWLFAHDNDALSPAQFTAFETLLARREAGEPVAYLTGLRGFWTLDLQVTPATLIPRPETERLVECALAQIPAGRACSVLDLGTGSGAIALAIARERPQARVLATDASEAALHVAQANAKAHGIENVAFRHGRWFGPLAHECFDLIASNPPYIEAADPHLRQGDLRFEPITALAAGEDGLDDLRIIVRDAPSHLHAGGALLVEHGWNQGAAVRALFDETGFSDIHTAHDLEGRERITQGRWP